MIPDIQVVSYRNKELIILQIHHMAGPFYLESLGIEKGTYVRLGSTNRVADKETILSLQMLTRNTTFDELPCLGSSLEDIDSVLIRHTFDPIFGNVTKKQYASLGIVINQNKQQCPSNAGILLFSHNRGAYFSDATIDCVCFASSTRENIIDRKEIQSPLIQAHIEIISFINRNTRLAANIGAIERKDEPQYPPVAIREAVINAIVHADYAMKGARVQIAIFSDRIEITNPGGLPYGQTIDQALSGISRMRNRVIGRLFRELKLIERLGTGIKRIIGCYHAENMQPVFEEFDTHFRVTLYSDLLLGPIYSDHEILLIDELQEAGKLSVSEIAKLWNVTTRTARSRLKQMLENQLVQRIASSAKDPYAVYKLYRT
jgi:predicted HTH transcriptional regulator